MSPKSSAEIRQAFLEFFRSKKHAIVPSAPIVVKNDPTLMFTNAGMNQFKDYFLGTRTAPDPRVADTQKCLRVSGKHNDLEEVGVDHYHHTMFEMLGNWSFGDYFKKEAIEWSWELLTKVLGIPEDRLYVTVFEGDAAEGLPRDEEAAAEWRKWTAPERILLGNKKDNFWEMGDTGPCGPCTEIHVDTRPEADRLKGDGASLVNKDHPEVIEVWNNVFIQFNRLKSGALEPLPARHVDTGMGFERLVRVLQGARSNYDTDVFRPLMEAVCSAVQYQYGGSDSKSDIAVRVLADHIRAISFTIADGQLPSNTGAGYVIRRILRRAVRYYYSYLNFQQPLLHRLVPVLAGQLADVFPGLKEQEAFVAKVIREEEEAFLRTLDKGLRRIEEIIRNSGGTIGGREAFELYDTYGFPLDLTRLIAGERGLSVDEGGFEAAMKEQKDRSRAATVQDAGDWTVLGEGASQFIGYDTLSAPARILRHRRVKGKGKESVQVVLDRTPFYAESGGQVGDRGVLEAGGRSYPVLDTKKENDLIIHILEEAPEGAEVTAQVDPGSRQAAAAHHSATHLLHAALKTVLGAHVAQKGSLVSPGALRFDFAHFSKLTAEELRAVEDLVNEKIRENVPVVIREMDREAALQSGATALFGEKYGDRVRVVTMDPQYSVELCGGTHVASTGALGLFKITSEGAVAAGVRRIEALSGAAALAWYNDRLAQLEAVTEALKGAKDPVKAAANLVEENAGLRKKLAGLEEARLQGQLEGLLAKAEPLRGGQFLGAVVEAGSADSLRKLALDLKARLERPVLALGAAIEGKAQVVVVVDESHVAEGLDAGALLKTHVAPLIKGGGGGQKTLATAGGSLPSALQEAISAVKGAI